jgi:hypothetical protein
MSDPIEREAAIDAVDTAIAGMPWRDTGGGRIDLRPGDLVQRLHEAIRSLPTATEPLKGREEIAQVAYDAAMGLDGCDIDNCEIGTLEMWLSVADSILSRGIAKAEVDR